MCSRLAVTRRSLSKAERRKIREARPELDRQYSAWRAAQPVEPKRPRRTSSRSRCGDVTIIQPDGTMIIQPAFTAAQVRRIAPERLPITPAMRARLLKRDRQTCRYCLTSVGPFEIDHVVPVAHGGETKMHNLVTACAECNRTKGARVWKPKLLEAVLAMPTIDLGGDRRSGKHRRKVHARRSHEQDSRRVS